MLIKRKFLIGRRYGVSLWGQARDPVVVRKYPPGQHGVMGYVKKSDFGKQLADKQKLKFHYMMKEGQFCKLYYKATRKKGDRVNNFIGMLESMLYVIVYRSKISPTIGHARQLVSHCHILINGKVANIPSMIVPIGSEISLSLSEHQNNIILKSIESEERNVPEYIEFDKENKIIKFKNKPGLQDVPYPFVVDGDVMNHIISFYSN